MRFEFFKVLIVNKHLLCEQFQIFIRISFPSQQNVTLLRPGGNSRLNAPIRMISVPAKGSVSVKYPLRIDELGEVPIQVIAFSLDQTLGDAVQRNVFVKVNSIN